MTKGLAWMVGLSTVAALMLASVAGVWLTNDLRVVGLAIVGITPIAAGVVGYFEWRANLLRKALTEQQHHRRDNCPNPVGRVPQNAVREKTVT